MDDPPGRGKRLRDRPAAPVAGDVAVRIRRITGFAGALPVLLTALENGAASTALDEIGAMGTSAAAVAPAVASAMNGDDPFWWSRATAALTLWRITREVRPVLPVLTAAWHGNVHTRTSIAEAADGELADRLAPLMHAELAESRRHGLGSGSTSRRVSDDERLLAALRAAVS